MRNKKKNLSRNNNISDNKTKESDSSHNLPWWKRPVVFFSLATILTVTFVLYQPILDADFTNWDDPTYVTENNYITSLEKESIILIFNEPIAFNYHPITMLSLAMNYSFSGLEPRGYHLWNVIFHLINTLLVFIFTYLLSDRKWFIGALCSLLFAIHPMHVESVAWISERKDVLFSLFFLGGLITWLKYLSKSSVSFYILTLFFFILSALSKPAAIPFPFIILLIDYFRNRPINRILFLDKVPFVIVSIIFVFLTLNAQTQDDAIIGSFADFNFFDRIFFASYGLMMYILKLFFPFQLSAFYPYPESGSNLPYLYYLSFFFLLALFLILFYRRRFDRTAVFGLLFFILNLVLVLQIVSVGRAIMADRYTYIPYIGIFFILAMQLNKTAINKSSSSFKKNAHAAGIIAFLLICFSVSTKRISVWKNSESLWTDVIKNFPDHPLAYNSLGNHFFENGVSYGGLNQNTKMQNSFKYAMENYNEAIRIDSSNYKSLINRGNIHKRNGDMYKAIRDYNSALKIQPNSIEGLSNRGDAYVQLNLIDSALIDLDNSISIKPTYEAYYSRGLAHKIQKKFEEAILDYNLAMRLQPNELSVFTNRGNIYFELQKYERAIEDYKTVLREIPNDLNANANIGAALLQLKEYEQAISYLNKAIELNSNIANFFLNRAICNISLGNKKQAAEDLKKASSLGVKIDQNLLTLIQ